MEFMESSYSFSLSFLYHCAILKISVRFPVHGPTFSAIAGNPPPLSQTGAGLGTGGQPGTGLSPAHPVQRYPRDVCPCCRVPDQARDAPERER